HEQLRTLGRILNVPVRVVDEQHSLQDVLDEFANKRLVLVDTAGLQAQDPQLRGQLKELAALGDRVSTLLVLAATSQYRVLRAARPGARSCVASPRSWRRWVTGSARGGCGPRRVSPGCSRRHGTMTAAVRGPVAS